MKENLFKKGKDYTAKSISQILKGCTQEEKMYYWARFVKVAYFPVYRYTGKIRETKPLSDDDILYGFGAQALNVLHEGNPCLKILIDPLLFPEDEALKKIKEETYNLLDAEMRTFTFGIFTEACDEKSKAEFIEKYGWHFMDKPNYFSGTRAEGEKAAKEFFKALKERPKEDPMAWLLED